MVYEIPTFSKFQINTIYPKYNFTAGAKESIARWKKKP